MIRYFRCALFALLSLSSSWVLAENMPAPAVPPRIGVVLGGGGARGFAHLGVLRELEKLHIPISCIAGTSAGALIGGMYANGLSLDEMQQSFKEADWSAMLSGKPSRAQVPYERKSDDYRNYFDLTFGVRDGAFRVPRSAINSQDVDLYIRALTRDRVVDSFDRLPIPFRAVATDLSNGDAVVFDRGALAIALRASMAVPGVFDPVSDQGRLLVDGGLARNLPIEDLKHRCADHLIVVDVGTPLLKTDQIHTLFDVLAQTSNLMVTRNASQQKTLLDDQDVVIRPDLTGFSSAAFVNNQAIIARGVSAVDPVRERLKAWAVSPQAYAAWHARLVPPPSPKIDHIRVEGSGASFINPEQLTKTLGNDTGSDGSLDSARQQLRTLFAGGDFDSLTYRVEDVDGRHIMQVMPVERSIGPNQLRFGLNLKNSTVGDASVTFLGSSLSTWLNASGATWRNDLQLGSDTLLRSELYQPLALGSPVFLAAQGHYKEEPWPFYDANHLKYAELTLAETGGELDVGVALGQYGQLRGGPYWLQYQPRVSMGALQPSQVGLDQKATEAGLHLSAVADQFDNPRWPRSGYFFDGSLRYSMPAWHGIDTRYYGLTAEDVMTLGDVTWRLTGKLKGNLIGANPNRFAMPQFLGGFLNMSGYQQDELYGDRISLGRLMVYWRAATLPSAFGSGIYAGASLELGKVWNRNFGDENTGWLPGGSVFLGADTLLGPFFIGVGTARGGRPIGYMYLGLDY
ncbi:patatin-like phospholipase family protein [Paludibacterium purpuratum]|uniref:NTE family protein n=1 Tax=Paludibacterium purpuratum TaxID=1144873 RepID=A0A4R7B7W3_9NEIS|nr:patatin-like phospholipase family protein [Paludibacterium purpuratum]TDR79677.1 NTE family protein [Paludibacterium purpuratum]